MQGAYYRRKVLGTDLLQKAHTIQASASHLKK
jgi:hypothetical protein